MVRKPNKTLRILMLFLLVLMTLIFGFMIAQSGEIAASGKTISFNATDGYVMDVSSNSQICIKAITDKGDVHITTPSGIVETTEVVGIYREGAGCFTSGRITFDGSVSGTLTSGSVMNTVVTPNWHDRVFTPVFMGSLIGICWLAVIWMLVGKMI